MRAIIVLIFITMFFMSCSSQSVPDKLNPDSIYKRDMIITIDGITREGVIVVPRKEKHNIHIKAQGDLDLFTFTTCHREEIAEEAWNVTERRGIFRRTIERKREIKLDYIPTFIELNSYCPIFIAGYEQTKGRHSWGMIDFESPDVDLPATLYCNGETIESNGVSICQSRNGLFQLIKFQKNVKVLPDKGCELEAHTGTTFRIPLAKGMCVYAFMEIASKRIHRLTTIGYELVPIRK